VIAANSRFVIVGLACLAAACASTANLLKTASLIERGDSRARVIQVLGAPADRQFSGDDEALQYCKTRFEYILGDNQGQYAVVWLYKGVVTGITTYRDNPTGSCANSFKTIHWEEAPDRTIEIRRRP
jgi:hypothetical protein